MNKHSANAIITVACLVAALTLILTGHEAWLWGLGWAFMLWVI